jgi:transposase
MPRKFLQANYAVTLNRTIRLGDALPPTHLARFVAAAVGQLDLRGIYGRYGTRGGTALAPEVLLGLLFYGYATGVFSSRKLEQATYESIPFRFLAGEHHPDHDTIAHFRKTFLPELKDLFVQLLLCAHVTGVLQLGNVSVDGTKLHADASKSHAVSYKRLGEVESRLQAEVEALFALAEQADQGSRPPADQGEGPPAGGARLLDEIARRQARLADLAQARAVLEERARVRYEAEQAAYEARVQARDERAQQTNRAPRGRPPTPPTPGPRDKDQYNFTDPDSRIMKNSTNAGFEQHYNAQVAVEQTSLLIVAPTLSNAPTDQGQALPTVDAIPAALGRPAAATLDNGYWSPETVAGLVARGIEPYIATGREPHHRSWTTCFATAPAPPPPMASVRVQMAYRLQTDIGHAIYRLRKCTVEPVIGIIKEVLGFRQFSLRGLAAAAGEWCLVCLAFNLKRLHILLAGSPLAAPALAIRPPLSRISPTGC